MDVRRNPEGQGQRQYWQEWRSPDMVALPSPTHHTMPQPQPVTGRRHTFPSPGPPPPSHPLHRPPHAGGTAEGTAEGDDGLQDNVSHQHEPDEKKAAGRQTTILSKDVKQFLRYSFLTWRGRTSERKFFFHSLSRKTMVPQKTITKFYYNDRRRNPELYEDLRGHEGMMPRQEDKRPHRGGGGGGGGGGGARGGKASRGPRAQYAPSHGGVGDNGPPLQRGDGRARVGHGGGVLPPSQQPGQDHHAPHPHPGALVPAHNLTRPVYPQFFPSLQPAGRHGREEDEEGYALDLLQHTGKALSDAQGNERAAPGDQRTPPLGYFSSTRVHAGAQTTSLGAARLVPAVASHTFARQPNPAPVGPPRQATLPPESVLPRPLILPTSVHPFLPALSLAEVALQQQQQAVEEEEEEGEEEDEDGPQGSWFSAGTDGRDHDLEEHFGVGPTAEAPLAPHNMLPFLQHGRGQQQYMAF